MNVLLWVLQVALGIYFFVTGILHFVVPPGLPEQLSWMYDLSPALHYISGTAEILGGLGLVLPALTRIRPGLTVLAASGLVLVMLGAAFYHLQRGEFLNIGMNLLLAIIAAFIAYGRWRMSPIQERADSQA